MTFNPYGGTTGVPESQQVTQTEDYAAPKPVGAAEGYSDPESTREALLRMGRAFNEGGVGRAVKEYQNDPNLVATLQRDPRLIASIANNPNPRNETPDSMAVNALAGAFYKTDVIRKMVTGNGMDESVLANPKTAPQGLWDQLRGVFTNAQAKPGSPQQIANEAYFGALTRGGGIPAATQAYAQTYVQAVQGQQQLTNTQLTKALDYGLKKADQASNAQRVASATARSLAGTGLDGTVISGISDEIGMISATAKDNPGVAVARSQALIQQLIDQNAPQSVINKVTTQLAPHVKLEGDAAKMYDEISKYDLSQGVLNRFKFGLSNESDLRQINRAREQYQLKEGRIKSQVELEKERLLKTDPTIMGGDVLRKANEKLLDINKERAEVGLPPTTLEEQFPDLVRGRAPVTAPGTPSVTEPVAPSMAPPSVTQSSTGLPQPVAPSTTGEPTQVSQPETTPGADLQGLKPIPTTSPAASVSSLKENIKQNSQFSEDLGKAAGAARSQLSTVQRLDNSIQQNPEFWGINTNSKAWRAFVDSPTNSPQSKDALEQLYRNANIPQEKRAQFDAVMNDYRTLEVGAITSSGLSATQLNTEKESQRIVNTIGSIGDRPEAARAALTYARAKIDYNVAREQAWARAQEQYGGRITRSQFNSWFDREGGPADKIFKQANEQMTSMLEASKKQKGGKTGTTNPRPAPSQKPANTGGWQIIGVE